MQAAPARPPAGEDVRALVVNAGCANSFTGRPGADARAGAWPRRRPSGFDCRQREVMLASTGVIGVLLRRRQDHRPPAGDRRRPRRRRLGATRPRAIMTTDTFPKGAVRRGRRSTAQTVRIAGIAKGSGMIAPDMATMLAFVATDAAIAPARAAGAGQALRPHAPSTR